MGVLSASERVTVFKAIGDNPKLLQYLTFPQVAGAIRWHATQADANLAIDFLVKWSKTSSPPVSKPGFIPGRSPSGYLNLNVEPYFRLARLFVENNVEQKIKILSDNIINEDGTCNLTIAYILCCICRLVDKPKIIAGLMDEHLLGEEAEKSSGDIRASWFLAEAFKYETVYGNDFQPGTGIEPLEKGLKVAESTEIRYRMFMELAARLISIDRSDEAQSLIMSIRDQYPDEEKQILFDLWLEKGTELKTFYEKLRAEEADKADTFAIKEYANEMKRRATIAESRGEKRTFDRYLKSVTEIEKKLTERQQKAQEK
jgi:hypothetical protein